jgi:RNase adapter protein RapZ
VSSAYDTDSQQPETGSDDGSVSPLQTVVVTGLSGAGKSTVLRSLEDLGFFCIDNLPTVLAPDAVRVCSAGGVRKLALCIDVRSLAFLSETRGVLEELAEGEKLPEIVFCDATDETILRRFSETRRPHALASQGNTALAVLDGVRLERERLAALRARATWLLDTTNLSVHELRRLVLAHFGPASGKQQGMVVRFVSFGFKYGAPVDADLLLDVRFLENPYFVKELRPLAGTDEPVRTYVLAQTEAQIFLEKTEDLLRFVLPKYEREGKSYLTVAIGCTGGRHRSVAITVELAKRLEGAAVHRDLLRDPGQYDLANQGAGHTGRLAAVSELTMQLSPLPASVGSLRAAEPLRGEASPSHLKPSGNDPT